ncbi:FAD-binding oxidoreductase [Labrenzia sp. PHM005]|uniref:FAD-binding oxidoreductase n=1 Tax=Labrenzia sp. PHM005 TaxID=2590016 RepID=UPI001AD918F5
MCRSAAIVSPPDGLDVTSWPLVASASETWYAKPDANGFFWLAGQGGYGVQTAPALSQLVADLCLHRKSDLPLDVVQALDPSRLI